MPLYLISGTAGTGKTAVCDELKARGFAAYDTDDDALARWQNVQTGYVHPKSSVKPHMRTPEFIAGHVWTVPREMLRSLLHEPDTSPVFVCGNIGNEEDIRDMFKAVFALYVDEATLKHRLATRTSNDWGKQPHELEQTLAHYRESYDVRRKLGDLIIDATNPVGQVADQIVAATEK